MKMKFRRMLSILLVLAMVVSFLPVLDLGVKASAAEVEEVEKTAVYEYYYDISEYRTNTEAHTANNDAKYSLDAVYTEYPAKEGYVFAGWYTALKDSVPLAASVTTGGAYAKFVPEELMKAVAQVSTATDYTTTSSALRFVAAVESRDYAQVGFLLNKEGSSKTYTHSVTYVYTSLSAAVEGGSLKPTYFHGTASHMFALTLTGIKDQGANYTATPFWITNDGTKVDHIPTAKKAVQMGIAANMAAGRTEVEEGYDYSWYTPSATEYTISSLEQMRAFMELSNTFNFAGKTVKLDADISFNTGIAGDKMISTGSGNPYLNGAVATDPIGSKALPFAGTFDGQNHTVSGLASKTGYDGLFAAINGATIKNVTVARSTLRAGSGGGCSAGLVGTALGTNTIENVRIAKDVNLWAATYQAGIVAHNQGHLTIKNTWSSARVNPQWTSAVYIGGFVGMNANNTNTSLTLENCLYDGTMAGTAQGSSFAGGLVGAAGNNPVTTITSCLVAGNMTGLVTSTGTLRAGSVIGSKSYTAANTKATGVYATNETYVNADGEAQTLRPDQSFTAGTVTAVAKDSLLGDLAETNAPNLNYASAWQTVTAGTPVLRSASADTTWYNDTDTVFTLYDAADLNGFAILSQTNTFAGKTVKLGADIIYNEGDASTWGTTPPAIEWLPIGDGDNGFTGIFDGQGHTISGLYYKGGGYATFVAKLYGASAKLLNVRIVNSYFESDGTGDDFHNGAGIVGRASNGYTVSGVYTNAYFKGVKSMGIVAFSDVGVTNISNCWNDGTMDVSALTKMGSDPGVGGMVGFVPNNQTHNITNCLVTATFTGALDDGEYLGGIFGMAAWGAKVMATDCLVAGDMSGVTGGVVGSIAGNNPGGNGSVYTDVYATTETHANLKGSGGATIPVTTVAEADILGDAAAATLTGLDFAAVWSVRANDVPQLGVENVDISWYNANATEFVLYDIADLNGLAHLAKTINFSGKTIKLGADITANTGNAADWAENAPAIIWTSIGSTSLPFRGTFDGQNHTISGLYQNGSVVGLFGSLSHGGTVKNLKLLNSYFKGTGTMAAIAAFSTDASTFENVYTDAILSGAAQVGGFIGRSHGTSTHTIKNCTFAGTANGTQYVGGFVAYVQNAGTITITGSTFSGSVTATTQDGAGFVGFTSSNAKTLTIDNCVASGSVTGPGAVGGFIGRTQAASGVTHVIKNSEFTGTVTATASAAGGFVGQSSSANVSIENSEVTSTAAVNGHENVGGFVGEIATVGYTTTITDSTFNGAVTAADTAQSSAGGFVGLVTAGKASISGGRSSGSITTSGWGAAGFIGVFANSANASAAVDKCWFDGTVNCASSNAGGIYARSQSNTGNVDVSNSLSTGVVIGTGHSFGQFIGNSQRTGTTYTRGGLNNFYYINAGSTADIAGVGANGGQMTNQPLKVSDEKQVAFVEELFQAGMYPDYNGFISNNTISDVQDYYGFMIASFSNTFSGKTVTLANDITINEGDAADWLLNAPKYKAFPIGGVGGSFAGTFDGQGHTISGLYVAFPNGNSMGMFREVKGTVKNFKLVNSHLENTLDTNYGYNGGIVAYLNGGTVSQVYTDAYVLTMDSYSGGIVGFTGGATATVSECVFDGLLMARCVLTGGCGNTGGQSREHANWIGGIMGAGTATNTNISDCIFSGKIMNECGGAHRTGGIIGGLPTAGKAATITGCFSLGEFARFNAVGDSYHFSLLLDCRGAGGAPTNEATMFADNYILDQKLYDANGEAVNRGSALAGANGSTASTIRYTEATLIEKIETAFADGTTNLDFVNVWNFNAGALPTLKWMGGTETTLNTHYLTTEEGGKLLSVTMPEGTFDDFVDMTIEETESGQGTYTDDNGETQPYLYLEQVNSEAVSFQDIFYGDGTYLTKYVGTNLVAAQSLITSMKAFGFEEVISNNINEDCYYTALTFGGNVYTVTHFVETSETYISVSNEQNLSPFMDSEYYKTAVNTAGGEPVAATPYSDVTITSVALDNGGDAFVIRLKNGHYIIIDGGTNRQSDRERIAEALGASAEAYTNGEKNNPQIVVDAWFFTHAHGDHAGIFRGGIYGALQVDVYIKGFYYNFTPEWHVDSQIRVGGTDEAPEYADGYVNQCFYYVDQDANGKNYYRKGYGDITDFWVEWTATHKTAANVNIPSWGSAGIPIYRVQAGQKFYFDGMTVEVPYTQEQVQPSEINLDLNGTCSWFLLTDDYGHTFLDAGDAELFNAEAVAELYSADYELFGADIGKTFHHGLNSLVKHTGTFGESPSASTAGNYDYTLVDAFYGINTEYGDGNQTKFVFITKGASSWTQISGYNSCGGSQRDLSIHEMYYLFGYILSYDYDYIITSGTKPIRDYVSWGYATVDTKIPFAAYGGDYVNGDYTDTFEGTTTVTMSESGITWDKYHTRAIYD